MPGVNLDGVVKAYGAVQVVHGIDLAVAEKEFVVLVGPSGCGKSTTLRMIAGLEEITQGDLTIDGRRMNRVAPKDRDVAMVFQNYALYPHLNVADNMAFGLRIRKMPKNEIKTTIADVAEILGLTPYLDRRPADLSGGQRQRVAMGRAIVRHPKVFLFDEPLSNLDAELRVDMRVEIARLHKELGTTMVYVTHDQVEAMTLADKIVVLRAGSIEQVGAPMHLYKDPDNKFVAGFIGSPSMNFVNGEVTDRGVLIPALGGTVIPTQVALPATGSSVTVGLRPQELLLNPGDGDIKLELRERLGGVAYDYLRCATGERLIVESRNDEALPEGTTINVDFDPAAAYFFDAETETRLR